eukprot:SAG31_NODE_1598_length_7798_cov_7.682167_2_plen_603_part_00
MPATVLGIECGGTRSSFALDLVVEGMPPTTTMFELGPANFKSTSDAQWAALFVTAASKLALPVPPAGVGIAVAGARHRSQQVHLEELVKRSPLAGASTVVKASHDLESALLSRDNPTAGGNERQRDEFVSPTEAMIVIAGTGSCCYGRRGSDGVEVRGGGWGSKLGDEGSGFAIGSVAIRYATTLVDHARQQNWQRECVEAPLLPAKILAAAGLLGCSLADDSQPLAEWDAMIDWAAQAGPADIAKFAPICLEMAAGLAPTQVNADAECLKIVKNEAAALANTAAGTLRALVPVGQNSNSTSVGAADAVEVLLCGGLFSSAVYEAAFVAALAAIPGLPSWTSSKPSRPSVMGAVELGRQALTAASTATPSCTDIITKVPAEGESAQPSPVWRPSLAELGAKSPTELRNPASMELDKLHTEEAVRLFLAEDAALPGKIAAHAPELARLVDAATAKLAAGGRLLYCGAGSSGRLGVLDAAECPPTFGTEPAKVQGLIAGGTGAILKAVEGAEDSAAGGEVDVNGCGVMPLLGGPINSTDLLVGIAASGRTPYIWGAMAAARAAGACTALLCFNPNIATALEAPAAAGNKCVPSYMFIWPCSTFE